MAKTTRHGMQELWNSSHLNDGSAAWLESLYESWLTDRNSVSAHWQQFFDSLPARKTNGSGESALYDVPHAEVRRYFRELAKQPRTAGADTCDLEQERKQVNVLQLINAFRFRGHQVAHTNPLPVDDIKHVPELELAHHGLSETDLDTVFETGSLAGVDMLKLRDIYAIVQATYCGSVGVEYMHIVETEEKRWLQNQMETAHGEYKFSDIEKINILQQLTVAEGLERFLHTKYVGQKRFSLEGGESLIPLLDELVMRAGESSIKEVVIGMAHRGRLNVLVNILGKKPQELFSEFEGTKDVKELTGDVKYHMGFASDMDTPGGPVHLALAFNPSHLEIVGPVVEGSVRARQYRRGDREGNEVIPVQIHGDAAFSGQGVVMETLQMSQSRGYTTHGTVHIIVNNQIGFTTSLQRDARSTTYCTDVAKMVDAPIFHVNGDDPEAVVAITRLALKYRMLFKKDVVIDLVCYRRHGHNEADEPRVTQPMMYKKIERLATTREQYADKMVRTGVLTQQQVQNMVDSVRAILEAGECVVPHILPADKADISTRVNWQEVSKASILDKVDTSVPIENIKQLYARIEQIPEGFELHPRVAKIMEDRHKMAHDALPIDWGFAETMAYATLVYEGYSVRLSGQDSGRGTFFHRHAVLHNQKNGEEYVPLRTLGAPHANFRVFDSLLSELAVLAFEYGFATAEPNTLTLWEAQFGDFANGAQVVIDQFIVSGEHKWGRYCGLVMLLPHGFEGQGAEHSSARLERYLQLCAVHNIQVCVPSTPAQIFHLLRRQMIRKIRKPLIVMTPKSLLRHKLCVSSLQDFSEGGFQWVLPDTSIDNPEKVSRVILCSGKIYYELLDKRDRSDIKDIALVRLEQIYPLPGEELDEVLSVYTGTNELIWCQEEPKNQGAWDFVKLRFAAMLNPRWQIGYVGREPSAVPAVGSAKLHGIQQKELVNQALKL